MISIKRMREEDREVEALAMANCLMLLSRVGAASTCGGGRVFTCKTCYREFSSFQALGGHRASHKKSRLVGGSGDDLRIEPPASKPKSHECSICGVEFPIGQALGGHMRRHRLNNASSSLSTDNSSSDDSKSVEAVPVLKKTNSSGRGKRVLLCLDLNLTPLENHIKKINQLSSSSSAFSSRLIA